MMAVKSGIISADDALTPLKDMLHRFGSKLDLIRVITPKRRTESTELNEELNNLKTNFKTTENATVFQGVLEHIHESNPDILCVIRRKRGFFVRLWEKDRVYKKDFESRIPLLVLKGAF